MAVPVLLRIASWRAPGDDGARCGWHALAYWPVCGRAIRVALNAGTLLMVINQGDVLLSGHLTVLIASRILLTNAVPFSVSTYSGLAANRLHGG